MVQKYGKVVESIYKVWESGSKVSNGKVGCDPQLHRFILIDFELQVCPRWRVMVIYGQGGGAMQTRGSRFLACLWERNVPVDILNNPIFHLID